MVEASDRCAASDSPQPRRTIADPIGYHSLAGLSRDIWSPVRFFPPGGLGRVKIRLFRGGGLRAGVRIKEVLPFGTRRDVAITAQKPQGGGSIPRVRGLGVPESVS